MDAGVYLLIMGSLRLVASFNVKENFMEFLFGLLTTPRILVFVMRSNHKPFWPAQNDGSLMQDQKRRSWVPPYVVLLQPSLFQVIASWLVLV